MQLVRKVEDGDFCSDAPPSNLPPSTDQKATDQKETTSPLRVYSRLATLFMAAVFVYYARLFWRSLAGHWFHPHWTTDDALQQIYPFHAIAHPKTFEGDFITEMVRGYLAPLHFAVCALVTRLVGDPIMMGHVVMFIQLASALLFIFLAVRSVAGSAAGLFAATWLLHTRYLVQRLTGGLPRGWAAPLIVAFLYLLFTKRHRSILVLLLIGCLLHPPASLLLGTTYGVVLVAGIIPRSSRAETVPHLIRYLCVAPLLAVVTLVVVHRPESMGQMVSYHEASQMPEFLRPKGRFPYIPLLKPWSEIRMFGFQAFGGRFYNPGARLKESMPWVAIALLGALALVAVSEQVRSLRKEASAITIRRASLVPGAVWGYLCSIFLVYTASRILAFRLYVPDRHLQFPLAIFFIVTFTIAAWNIGQRISCRFGGVLGLSSVAALVVLFSGLGLQGDANFNFSFTRRGGVFAWMQKNTPERALIAGEPTFIDPVQLFAIRRGYATTETAHPFYPRYYAEIKRRLEVSLRAHYAASLEELYEVLKPEGVSYFVFDRQKFYPDTLARVTYFAPLDGVVESLTRGDGRQFAYRELPGRVDLTNAPYLVYRDSFCALVDIAALGRFLKKD